MTASIEQIEEEIKAVKTMLDACIAFKSVRTDTEYAENETLVWQRILIREQELLASVKRNIGGQQ